MKELMTKDLVTWLRAQLQHDEGMARMAFAEHNRAVAEWHEPWSGTVQIGPDEDDLCCNDSGVSRHIVNWDPARVLAQVDAKRRILDLRDAERAALTRSGYAETAISPALRAIHDAIRLLATVYADRPGYREEWRL